TIWELAGAAGGALALAFIVVLALGLLALTGLFAVAAAVVLERFARQQRRWRSALLAGLAWTVAVALVAIDLLEPDALLRREVLLRTLPAALGAAALAVALAMATVRIALRLLSPRAL